MKTLICNLSSQVIGKHNLFILICLVGLSQSLSAQNSPSKIDSINRTKQRDSGNALRGFSKEKIDLLSKAKKDTLTKKGSVLLLKKTAEIKTNINDKISVVSDTAKANKKLKELYSKNLDKLGWKKGTLDSVKKSKKISFKDIVIENSSLVNASGLNVQKASLLNNFSVSGQVELFKFPLTLDLASNANEFRNIDPREALFKVNFDRSQYQQLYKNDLGKLERFKKTILGGQEVNSYLKKQVAQKLKHKVTGSLPDFPRLNNLLNNKEQLNQLLSLNEAQIKEKVTELMSDQQHQATGKLDSLSGEKKQALQEEISRKKAEVANEILALKRSMEESGLDQQRLLLIQNFITNQGSLNDIDAIFQNEMNQEGKLTGIKKFYTNIKALQVGDFGQRLPGSFQNREQMMNGFNFTVKTGRGPVNLGMGLNKDGGMPKDAEFNSSMYDSPKLLTYVSIPTSNFSFGSGKLSWLGAFDKQKSNGFNQLNSLPKSGVAFTANQNVEMNTAGRFTFEISKSSVQYKNISIGESDKMLLNNDLKMGNYFRDDILETMSLGVKHNIELKKFGLTSNTFFSYSGLGYQNPGQQGYGNMGMRLGGNLRKNMFKNRVVINMRTDLKNTPISATSGAHWQNHNFQLDSRFRLSKNYTVNLKYQENGVNKVDGTSAAVYTSQKIQADMNANYKVGSNYAVSHISIGKQLMLNPTLLTNTNFMTVICSQHIILKSISLSGNAFYNKELSGLQILGDMLNADMGCQYNLLKGLNLSSAVTYLDNQNIARQLGLRQNIQLSVLKNFDVTAFIDLRKNLIEPLYPELFSAGRGELSIRYFINK